MDTETESRSPLCVVPCAKEMLYIMSSCSVEATERHYVYTLYLWTQEELAPKNIGSNLPSPGSMFLEEAKKKKARTSMVKALQQQPQPPTHHQRRKNILAFNVLSSPFSSCVVDDVTRRLFNSERRSQPWKCSGIRGGDENILERNFWIFSPSSVVLVFVYIFLFQRFGCCWATNIPQGMGKRYPKEWVGGICRERKPNGMTRQVNTLPPIPRLAIC